MNKIVENSLVEGMHKDVDKSLMSDKAYLDATNYRIITTQGSTTGSLENILGNKSILPTIDNTGVITNGNTYYVVYGSVTYNTVSYAKGTSFVGVVGVASFTGTGLVIDTTSSIILANQRIIGSCEIRDDIVLFTTNNTRSCIYKLVVNIGTETQTSITRLYDDSLNNSGGTLDFNTAYPIKAIGRYETSTIQKVYWTDGYNNVRYANVAENLTTTGAAYNGVTVFYFSVDKFEFQPNFEFSKPELEAMVAGSLKPSTVQYAYQLYKLNGAETTISPLSNTIHITSYSDSMGSTVAYKGEENTGESAGKGCMIKIDNTANIGYNRLRLYRVQYFTKDSVPTVSIVSEQATSTAGEILYITDNGSSINTITIDEFNIASTELFSAEDIESKDNRLFAANIEEDVFDISNFDCRAIRFRHDAVESFTDTDSENTDEGDGTATYSSDFALDFTVNDILTLLAVDPARTVTGINSVIVSNLTGNYTDIGGPLVPFVASSPITATNISFVTPALSFRATSSTQMFTNFVSGPQLWDYILVVNYSYTEVITYDDAIVNDLVAGDITITPPLADTIVGWNNAGWSAYLSTYDGINRFNDPGNDYDDTYAFKFQSDCATLGAEGPNVIIGFDTEDITLADANTYYNYTNIDGASYDCFASPFLSGKRSWQRDEVYRIAATFFDERGRSSYPYWVTDLKMPSLKDTGFDLVSFSDPVVTAKVLYPTFEFKNLPTGAVSAQIYAVPRSAVDKSIVTQALVIPCTTGATKEPDVPSANISTTTELVKLVSPEILINRDIVRGATDYLDYVGDLDTSVLTTGTSGADPLLWTRLRDFDKCTKSVNNETTILDSVLATPGTEDLTIDTYTFKNYSDAEDSYGCTGLFVKYANTSWTPEGTDYALVNYRRDLYGSQYGGYTYEARAKNYYKPCSDLITSTGSAMTCYGGDTFINYFECLSFLSDLTLDCGAAASYAHVVYFPVESSINCDLRHDDNMRICRASTTNYLMQEVSGEWEDLGANIFNQPTNLYLYNPVYSQESTLDYRFAKPVDYTDISTFDCRVKVSNIKVNGEISDKWTKFGINEYLEVDPRFGEIGAIKNVNDVMLFWQDRAFGTLAVNDRSLITDNSSAKLVLGTGEVLDRYSYISDRIGCSDKFSIVRGKGGIYWYDRNSNSLQQYAEQLIHLSRVKDIQSYLDSIYDSAYLVISAYDLENDEILFTFFRNNATKGYNFSYNEIMGYFISRYTFIPNLYIPFKNKILSTTSSYYSNSDFNMDRIFLHNSLINDRCYFYGLSSIDPTKYHTCTLKALLNPDYSRTKVFDNLYFITSLYNTSDVEIYDITFDSLRFYNDYQNTDYVTPVFGTTLRRRERRWSMAIPRNVVDTNVSSYPDIFTDIDASRLFKERMRDKYLIVDLVFTNDGTFGKFVFNKIGLSYRDSVR